MTPCESPESDYHVASLNGVTFDCTKMEDEFGRRGPNHQFPDRDLPYAEDLGRAQQKFVVSGYYIGDDHVARAHALKSAAERISPAVLVHPIWGRLLVKVEECAISHDLEQEQRKTSIKIKAVEFGALSFPSGLGRLGSTLLSGFGALRAVLADSLSASWSVQGLPPSRVDEIVAIVGSAASALEDALLPSATWIDATVDLAALLATAIVDPESYVPDPAPILLDAIPTIYAGAESYGAALAALRPLMRYSPGAIVDTGGLMSGRVADAQNLAVGMIRVLAVYHAALAAMESSASVARDNGEALKTKPIVDVAIGSTSEALALLAEVRSVLAQEIAIAAGRRDDQLYRALRLLRRDATLELQRLAFSLPSRFLSDMCDSLPSLAAAYRATGDARDVLNIERLNPHRSAWFLPKVIEARR